MVEPCSCGEEVLSEFGGDGGCGWPGVELPSCDVADGTGPGLEADGVGGLVAEEVDEPGGWSAISSLVARSILRRAARSARSASSGLTPCRLRNAFHSAVVAERA